MSLLLLVLLVCIPIWFLLIATRKRRNLPPSPPRLPFIGNLHQLRPPPHKSLQALSKKYGPLMYVKLGQVPFLIVSSPETAAEVMKKQDTVFASRAPHKVAEILFHGNPGMAFVPYSDHWKQVRKICVTHLLGPKMVKSFHDVREHEVSFLLNKIHSDHLLSSSSSSKRLVDMNDVLNSFIIHTVYRIFCGGPLRESGREGVILELVEEGNYLLGSFHVLDCFPMLTWLNYFFGLYAKAKKSRDRWDAEIEQVLDEHAQRSSAATTATATSFLDILLSFENPSADGFALNRDEIRSILIELIGAGIEPTFSVLLWSMTELVLNQKAMKKLQDEVREVGRGKEMILEEDLTKLSYLKAVVKETLRLHPPLPLCIPRESMEDCQVAGYDVPKKTRVMVNAWAICRDPGSWDAPDEFRPERFMGNSVDYKGSDFNFIPFGAGRRICAGMNFAPPLIETVLANLVCRFDWVLPDGVTRESIDKVGATGLTTADKHKLLLYVKMPSST